MLVTTLFRYSVLQAVVLVAWAQLAIAQAIAPDRVGADVVFEPGVSVDVYDTGSGWRRLRDLVPNQTPNVSLHQDNIRIGKSGIAGYSKNYYVEITGELLIDKPGKYQFVLKSDDGSVFEIDEETIINHDGIHPMKDAFGSAKLSEGAHPFRVRMFQAGGKQGLELGWIPPGATVARPIPTSSLRTEAGLTRVVSPGSKVFDNPDKPAPRPGDQRPLEDVHPMWRIVTLNPVAPEGFDLKVAGMDYLGDGRLVLAVFDPLNNRETIEKPNGELWILDGVNGDPDKVKATLAASGLTNPLGVLCHDGAVYVAQRDEITRFTDTNGDGVFDQRRTIADGWITNNYHQFTFGPVFLDGYLYATLSTSIGTHGQQILKPTTFGTAPNPPHRGSLMKIDPSNGDIEYIAGGLRTPNGLFLYDGELFVGENQGAWQPASKLNHLRPGRFYGHYNGNAVTSDFPDGAPSADFADQPVTPPAVYLPQGEIANSPTDGVVLSSGPFAGHLLISDVKHGGLRRLVLEKVNGQYQGVALRHSQGFNAGLNRLAFDEDGVLYCGGIGERKSWSWRGTTAGLQRLEPTGETTYEFHDMTATPDGLRVRFTRPVDRSVLEDVEPYAVKQWRYRPTSAYGGPKIDEEDLTVAAAVAGSDGQSVTLRLPGIKAGRVVYLHADLPSATGEKLWSPEAWYTMNQIPGQPTPPEPDPLTRLLLFTKTERFRHKNIPDGVTALKRLANEEALDLIHTENAAVFTDQDLSTFDVVIFFNTSGNILNKEQQQAFERFIQAGGGFVGIHAATDTEHNWPWFNELVGGYFAGHPPVQPAEMDVLIPDHPSTEHLPERWKRTDEWYNFKSRYKGIRVLINLDETTYKGGKMGDDHPIAWYHHYDGGRSWYTAGGHTHESFSEPDFLEHIEGGIRWAAGLED